MRVTVTHQMILPSSSASKGAVASKAALTASASTPSVPPSSTTASDRQSRSNVGGACSSCETLKTGEARKKASAKAMAFEMVGRGGHLHHADGRPILHIPQKCEFFTHFWSKSGFGCVCHRKETGCFIFRACVGLTETWGRPKLFG